MLKKRFILVLLCASCCLPFANAQEFLSLDSAIVRAMTYNFDVQIASINSEIARTNNTLGNTGMLPNISLNAATNESVADTRFVRSDGTVTTANAANTFSYSAGINGTYNVFAGGRAFILKKQLGKRVDFANALFRTQVQSTLSNVIQAYANVVNGQQQMLAIDTAIALAKARMDLSKAKYEVGTSAKVDYLQGRVDYNTARTHKLSQNALQIGAIANLNALMGEVSESIYEVADSLPINLILTPADSSILLSRSPALEAQRINSEISKLDLKVAKSYLYPNLGVNLGYGYSHSQSDAGLTLSNRSFGPNGGIGFSLPFYQGGNGRRLLKVASLNALSAEFQLSRQEREISRQYRSAWGTYKSAVAAYYLEAENRSFAKENLEIQQARFRVGVATSLELREAENSYIASLAGYYAAAYSAKVAETIVLEIEARLGIE